MKKELNLVEALGTLTDNLIDSITCAVDEKDEGQAKASFWMLNGILTLACRLDLIPENGKNSKNELMIEICKLYAQNGITLS